MLKTNLQSNCFLKMFLFSYLCLSHLVICLELTLSDDEDLHIFEYINKELSYINV